MIFKMNVNTNKYSDDISGEVLDEMGLDSLVTSEWQKIESIVQLLGPFADHTNRMQTDCFSLSYIIPMVFDLLIHLQDSTLDKSMASDLEQALTRFDVFTDPASHNFDALPAAACLLSPDVAPTLFADGRLMNSLLEAGKAYIIHQVLIKKLQLKVIDLIVL